MPPRQPKYPRPRVQRLGVTPADGQAGGLGNKIRVSDATDDEALALGVDRRKASPTPKPAPQEAPGITLDHLAPGVIYYRLHDRATPGRAPARKTPSARRWRWWMARRR